MFKNNLRNILWMIPVLFMISSLVSCSKSVEEIVQPHLASYVQFRASLMQIADIIPPQGQVINTQPQILIPEFNWVAGEEGNNADGLMFELLANPELDEIDFELNLSDNISFALVLTGSTRPNYGDPDVDFLEKTLEQAKNIRYLVVHRINELILPQALDQNTYTQGSVKVDGFVIDMQNIKIVVSYTLESIVDSEVSYSYIEGESRQTQLAMFVRSSMWTDIRNQIEEKLREVTSGRVRFN